MNKNKPDSIDSNIWSAISGPEEIEPILQDSNKKPQLIYKHSHRCSVCVMAKQELEEVGEQIGDLADLYMVNVIENRELSNAIASELDIRHESPQVIILKDQEVFWTGSHWDIKGEDIMKRIG